MSTKGNRENDLTALDKLIDEITVDAYGDDETLWAFRQAFEDKVDLPADGFVIGQPVSVIEVDYDGNERRGLTARCRREDGSEYVVSLSDIECPRTWAGANYIAAYRRWLNLDPFPAEGRVSTRHKRQHKVADDDIDPFNDPITRSNDLKDAGERAAAVEILMELCLADLRCLDAHSHLGNFVFEHSPQDAVRHYEVGLRIGELSLGDDFNGVLPWGLIDNRPFLRCIHGYGLCLWRLGRFEEAGRVFHRMLWLIPSDNQGVRFLIGDVKARRAWEDREAG